MTRDEELHARANNFLHQHKHGKNCKLRNCTLNCLRGMLLRVEWEVWAKCASKIESLMEHENESTDDQIWELRDWCKHQQEGL